jgi:uncharacterized repeat protein (TIGR01451 family)
VTETPQRADLALAKTVSDTTPNLGDTITFTVTLTNNGPDTASGVQVTDLLPAGLTFVSATPSQGSYNDLTGLWIVGTVNPGVPQTLTITAAVNSPVPQTNTATIGFADQFDPNTANNTASATETPPGFQPPIIVLPPDKRPKIPAPVLVIDHESGQVLTSFLAYEPTFLGGTRAVAADLTGDGIDEIITAPGRGRAGEVRVFTQDGVELTQFRTLAYPAKYKGGVSVAVADVNGDGLNDIITAPSSGKAEIRVFLNQSPNTDPIANTPFKKFIAFPKSVGGAGVRAADMGMLLNGSFVNMLDGKAEIIVGSGPGIKATIKVFDVSGAPTAVRTVFPFSTGGPTYKNGVNLDVARLDSDLIPDIIVGSENGGNSRVETYVWNTANASLDKTGTFMAYGDSASKLAPVRVAGVDTDGDGIADEIATVQGPNGTTQQVRIFDILNVNPLDVQQTATLAPFPGPYFIAAIPAGSSSLPAPQIGAAIGQRLDVDGDGSISALDALLASNYLNQQKSKSSSLAQASRYDVNGDGQITAADALAIVDEFGRKRDSNILDMLLTELGDGQHDSKRIW